MVRSLTRITEPDGNIVFAEDIKFKTIKEDWNVYELDDGSNVRIKIIAQKIAKKLEDDKKTISYNEQGEPIYNVRYSITIVADVAEKLLKL